MFCVNKVGISTLFGKQGVPVSVMLFCGFAISWHHVDSWNVQCIFTAGLQYILWAIIRSIAVSGTCKITELFKGYIKLKDR